MLCEFWVDACTKEWRMGTIHDLSKLKYEHTTLS